MSEFENWADAAITTFSRFTIGARVAANTWFPVFTKMEARLLAELRGFVSAEFRAVFDEHIGCINYCQRDGGHRALRMYQWKFPAHYDWRRTAYFEPRDGIGKQLRYVITFDNEDPLGGTLVSIDGVLCNLTFGADISHLQDRTNFDLRVRSGLLLPLKK